MVRDNQKYEQAVSLRKRGFTLAEVARYCDVSKSTASLWLKNNTFSADVTKQNKHRAGQENAKRLKLINKARGSERSNRYKDVLRDAETQFKHYQNDPLFVAGLMLYMAEGDCKAERTIRLSSVQLASHRIFIRFALEYLGIEKNKIHFWILLYSGHDEEKCMKKWHKITGLPYSQFYKNQYIKNQAKNQTTHYGMGNSLIGNTVLKLKLLRWIELLTKDLSKSK